MQRAQAAVLLVTRQRVVEHVAEAEVDVARRLFQALAEIGQGVVIGELVVTLEPLDAAGTGLSSRHRETDYYFCGKGCKLDFDDDPDRYLDPSHVPSMSVRAK